MPDRGLQLLANFSLDQVESGLRRYGSYVRDRGRVLGAIQEELTSGGDELAELWRTGSVSRATLIAKRLERVVNAGIEAALSESSELDGMPRPTLVVVDAEGGEDPGQTLQVAERALVERAGSGESADLWVIATSEVADTLRRDQATLGGATEAVDSGLTIVPYGGAIAELGQLLFPFADAGVGERRSAPSEDGADSKGGDRTAVGGERPTLEGAGSQTLQTDLTGLPKRRFWAPGELVGTLLHNRFRLQRLIGEGGFGAVYKAIDERVPLDVIYAIKVLSARALKSDEDLEAFRREFERIQKCQHPNIVSVNTVDYSDDGLHYFVMEYLEGEELEVRLKREKTLSVAHTQYIVQGILDALRRAHRGDRQRSILHLDLKPGNVFLVDDPEAPMGIRVKVLDFGIGQYVAHEADVPSAADLPDTDTPLAPTVIQDPSEFGHGPSTLASGRSKSTGKTGRTGTTFRALACTPEYAAPEHCAHFDELVSDADVVPLDGRADLYSLGAMAFRMLTGELPIDNPGSRRELARIKRTSKAKTIRSTGARVPANFSRFVQKLLETDRRRRFQDAEQAYEALDRILHPTHTMRTVLAVAIPLVLVAVLAAVEVLGRAGYEDVVVEQAGENIGEERGLAVSPGREIRLSLQFPESFTGLESVRLVRGNDRDGASLEGISVELNGDEEVLIRAVPDFQQPGDEPVSLLFMGSGGLFGWMPRYARSEVTSLIAIRMPDAVGVRPSAQREDQTLVLDSKFAKLPIEVDGLSADQLARKVAHGPPGNLRSEDVEWKTGHGSGHAVGMIGLPRTGGAFSGEYRVEVTDLTGGSHGQTFPLERLSANASPFDLGAKLTGGLGPNGDLYLRDSSFGVKLEPTHEALVSWELRATRFPGDSNPSIRSERATAEDRIAIDIEQLLAIADRLDRDTIQMQLEITGRAEGVEWADQRDASTKQLLPFVFDRRSQSDFIARIGEQVLSPAAPTHVRSFSRVRVESAIGETFGALARLTNVDTGEDSGVVAVRSDEGASVVDLNLPALAEGTWVLQARVLDSSVFGNLGATEERFAEALSGAKEFKIVVDETAPQGSWAWNGEAQVTADNTYPRISADFQDGATVVEWALRRSGQAAAKRSDMDVTRLPLPTPDADIADLLQHLPWLKPEFRFSKLDTQDGKYALFGWLADDAGNAHVLETLSFWVDRDPVIGGKLEVITNSDDEGDIKLRARVWDPNYNRDFRVYCVVNVTKEGGVPTQERYELKLVGAERGETSEYRKSLQLDKRFSNADVRFTLYGPDPNVPLSADQLRIGRITAKRAPAYDASWTHEGSSISVTGMVEVPGNGDGPYYWSGRPDNAEDLKRTECSNSRGRVLVCSIHYATDAIPDYYVDERLVSAEQYLQFLDSSAVGLPESWPTGVVPNPKRLSDLRTALAQLPPNDPATGVQWDEAWAYARWVGKRLLSIVEWEYVVRGGTRYWLEPNDPRIASLGRLGEWTGTPCRIEARGNHTAGRFARENAELCLKPHTDPLVLGAKLFWLGGSRDERDFADQHTGGRGKSSPRWGFRCALGAEALEALEKDPGKGPVWIQRDTGK